MKQLIKNGSRLKLKKEKKSAKLKNKVKLILIRVASIRMTSIKTSETVSLKILNTTFFTGEQYIRVSTVDMYL